LWGMLFWVCVAFMIGWFIYTTYLQHHH
jgi:hypothetical protein